jgi:hypothetical protein
LFLLGAFSFHTAYLAIQPLITAKEKVIFMSHAFSCFIKNISRPKIHASVNKSMLRLLFLLILLP